MKKWFAILLSLLGVLALAACSSTPKASTAMTTPEVPVVIKANAGTVIAEGTVLPARSSDPSFKISGEVVEILVQAGDVVAQGAPLVRLDTDEMALALRSAEQDVLAQQAALERLIEGASEKVIGRADKGNRDQIDQAQVALRVKELQLEKTRTEDPGIGVVAARTRVSQLQLTRAQAQAQAPAPAVTTAEVALERARIALGDTQNEYAKALDRPWEDQEIRDAWADRLEQVRLDYKAAEAGLENALDSQQAHKIGLQILDAQIQEAQTQLDQALVAQRTFSTTLEVLAADVDAARLQLGALRTWDNPYRDETSAQEIAQAQAMVEKARIAVQQLKTQMQDAVLKAPFDGTVVDVHVELGDLMQPGRPVVTLGTLDQLEVRTTDLTELDVAQVAVGQAAVVTVDALSDASFEGTVQEIALQGKDYRGDVVYEVTVRFSDPQPAGVLRWGMTTMVEIETQ